MTDLILFLARESNWHYFHLEQRSFGSQHIVDRVIFNKKFLQFLRMSKISFFYLSQFKIASSSDSDEEKLEFLAKLSLSSNW